MKHESHSANFDKDITSFEISVNKDIHVEYALSPSKSISVNIVVEDMHPFEEREKVFKIVPEQFLRQ